MPFERFPLGLRPFVLWLSWVFSLTGNAFETNFIAETLLIPNTPENHKMVERLQVDISGAGHYQGLIRDRFHLDVQPAGGVLVLVIDYIFEAFDDSQASLDAHASLKSFLEKFEIGGVSLQVRKARWIQSDGILDIDFRSPSQNRTIDGLSQEIPEKSLRDMDAHFQEFRITLDAQDPAQFELGLRSWILKCFDWDASKWLAKILPRGNFVDYRVPMRAVVDEFGQQYDLNALKLKAQVLERDCKLIGGVASGFCL